jgi:hypothetical protein
MKRFGSKAGAATLCGLLLSTVWGCATIAPSNTAVNRLAGAYGAGNAAQVEEMRYTFNVKIGDTVVRRAWSWEPREDRVTFNGTSEQGGRVSYARAALGDQPSDPLKKVDAWFINDNYWLIFPLRLNWDPTVRVTEDPAPAALPLGGGTGSRVLVSFPPSGGYTPGDVYELFLDNSGRIIQWIYRKGGDPKPTRMSTWEEHRQLGPLVVSLNRQGPDANFRVWFSDVAVRLKGQKEWVAAN